MIFFFFFFGIFFFLFCYDITVCERVLCSTYIRNKMDEVMWQEISCRNTVSANSILSGRKKKKKRKSIDYKEEEEEEEKLHLCNVTSPENIRSIGSSLLTD